MIRLLIRLTVGCNYQSWWEEDQEDEKGNRVQELFLFLSLSLSLSLVLAITLFVSPVLPVRLSTSAWN